MQSLKWKDSYAEFSKKIAGLMPQVGMDIQRGGWYDVVERTVQPGQRFHRYVWHDRKAWWQQEQGILAYLIMYGVYKDEEYKRLARESAAYYNAFFLDHDDGAVYFNTLANGLPYLLGNERLKGSHSMSGYHSMELCYLAAVYQNLLISKKPMDFYFKPYPKGLPMASCASHRTFCRRAQSRFASVEIDGKPYTDFDADALTVTLPKTEARVKIKVNVSSPTGESVMDVQVKPYRDATIVEAGR